jgi:hypothetical protein
MLSWVVADLATAKALLEHETVKSLVIVEALDAVIEWHERGVLPLARADDRSAQQIRTWRLFCAGGLKEGFDRGAPTRRFDAVLVDIDHSPNFLSRSPERGLLSRVQPCLDFSSRSLEG